jgi:hypothetical protein
MRRKKIGTKHFEGTIDITDPCYDRDVWCRMTAEVKAGEYDCHIWRHTSKEIWNGEEYKDVRVGIIGIYLDGIIPPQRSMEQIGSIGVDAGLAGFFMNKPDYNDEEWDDLCNSIDDGDAWIRDDGFFSSSGYGDGCYDVYAYKRDNEIVALEIRFI